MNVIKLQNIFLKRFKQINGVTVTVNNAVNFNHRRMLSSTLSCTGFNHRTTSCKNVQNLTFDSQHPALLNHTVIKRFNAKRQNNFLHPSRLHIASGSILCNNKKSMEDTIYYINRNHNNIRHFSNTIINSVSETKTPMLFSGIFKMISESTSVKVAQDILLWVHENTGLPWWSVIVLTTIAMRTIITLPLALHQQYIIAKIEILKHEMDAIIKELKRETSYGIHKYKWPQEYARRLYNHSTKKQWNKLLVRENCHPAKTGLLVLVQIPLWISLSMSIRNLCYMLPKHDASAYATYQQFTTDGFLWITNLTVPDPFVLPIAMGLFNLAIVEINNMNIRKKLTKFTKYSTYFFRIVAIGMVFVAMCVPSCVSLYWATSSAFGLLQNLILLSPRLRRFARVPVTASESAHPYSLLREKILARYNFKGKVEISSKT